MYFPSSTLKIMLSGIVDKKLIDCCTEIPRLVEVGVHLPSRIFKKVRMDQY
jgi:hypothetical protein